MRADRRRRLGGRLRRHLRAERDGGADVVRYAGNRGKGAALKTGFAWALENRPGSSVVCADCDGQHTPADIARIAAAVAPATMVLGGRRFTGRVPLRSRLGNAVSRQVFRAITGTPLHDTQTGLRAYPAELLPWLLRVEGDRFEYESNLLLQARAAGVAVVELPIETIYLDENASSHFRPVRDSLRIYAPLLHFGVASAAGAVVDWAGVLIILALTGSLVWAVVGARVASAWVNYRLNAALVFADAGRSRVSLVRYALLAAVVLGLNYTGLALLVGAGVPVVAAKLLVESVLFCLGFVVQRRFVFVGRRRSAPAVPPASKAAPAARVA